MNGIVVIRQLLAAHAGLTALVPASRIVAGELPQGVALPAITISEVSGVPRRTLTKGSKRHITSRIQVTAHSADQNTRHSIIKMVRNAVDHESPIVAGISEIKCLAEGIGPDLVMAEASIWQKSQDFKVSYSEAT